VVKTASNILIFLRFYVAKQIRLLILPRVDTVNEVGRLNKLSKGQLVSDYLNTFWYNRAPLRSNLHIDGGCHD